MPFPTPFHQSTQPPPSDQDQKDPTAVGSYFTDIEYQIEEDQRTSPYGCIGQSCCTNKEFKDYGLIEFSFHHQTTIQNHPLEYLFSEKVSITRKVLDVVILNPIHNLFDIAYNGISAVIGGLAATCSLALCVALPLILLIGGTKKAAAMIDTTLMFLKVTVGFTLATARSVMRLIPLVGLLVAKATQVGQYMAMDAAMNAGKVIRKTHSVYTDCLPIQMSDFDLEPELRVSIL